MKSNLKTVLAIFGFLFAFSAIVSTSFSFAPRIASTSISLKNSAISGKIHINGNGEWIEFKDAGNCTGFGTFTSPYVIKDLIIDSGDSESGILIENSDKFFKIVNCTIFGARGIFHAGIKLYQVENGQLINNTCSSNIANGIYLEDCNNNIISGNTIESNDQEGIWLHTCSGNTISENIIYNNLRHGILLMYTDNTDILGNILSDNEWGAIAIYFPDTSVTIQGNIMTKGGLEVYANFQTHTVDTTNLVNGKPLYYYTNEVNLGPNDFLNAGQVILANCHNSLISNLDLSDGSVGIMLFYCNNNEISLNTVNNGIYAGIYLSESDSNTIVQNTASFNGEVGILLDTSDYNVIQENTANNNDELGGLFLKYSNNNSVLVNTAHNNYNGIGLRESNFNTISGNYLSGNTYCIRLIDCEENTITNNACGNQIPGYNLYFLITIIPIVAILLANRLRRQK
jgi:parallel beta-helix repeat protein